MPEEVITLSYVDFVFINEGVLSLLSLLKTNLKNNLEKVPGIWFRDSDGKPKKGKSGQIITNEQMDIMMPGYAWDLLPKNNKIIKDNYIYIYAGAGITIDSNPEDEWNEIINKIS